MMLNTGGYRGEVFGNQYSYYGHWYGGWPKALKAFSFNSMMFKRHSLAWIGIRFLKKLNIGIQQILPVNEWRIFTGECGFV